MRDSLSRITLVKYLYLGIFGVSIRLHSYLFIYNFKIMFGTEFSKDPEILLSSFGEMHGKYKKIAKNNKSKKLRSLQKLYIKFLGILRLGFKLEVFILKKRLMKILATKKLVKF